MGCVACDNTPGATTEWKLEVLRDEEDEVVLSVPVTLLDKGDEMYDAVSHLETN